MQRTQRCVPMLPWAFSDLSWPEIVTYTFLCSKQWPLNVGTRAGEILIRRGKSQITLLIMYWYFKSIKWAQTCVRVWPKAVFFQIKRVFGMLSSHWLSASYFTCINAFWCSYDHESCVGQPKTWERTTAQQLLSGQKVYSISGNSSYQWESVEKDQP